MGDDIITLAKDWERGGTVENPMWLLRELITEVERLRELVDERPEDDEPSVLRSGGQTKQFGPRPRIATGRA